MLGILGLFYNNNKSVKKGEGSRQPVDLRSFFNLKHVILNLIFKTNNF